MKKYRLLKALKVVGVVVLATVVFGLVVMQLWNWLMPTIFGLTTLTFAQALGLLLLTKLLFGGFHKHVGGRGWRRHMEDRFANMTVEERERFRSGLRGRGVCGFGRSPETRSEARPV